MRMDRSFLAFGQAAAKVVPKFFENSCGWLLSPLATFPFQFPHMKYRSALYRKKDTAQCSCADRQTLEYSSQVHRRILPLRRRVSQDNNKIHTQSMT